MRTLTLFAVCVVLSFGLFAQGPALSGSCQTTGTYPSCQGGEVSFSGSGYSGQASVRVINGDGKVIDSGTYQTNGGILTFVENLSVADTYTVSVNGVVMLTVSTY